MDILDKINCSADVKKLPAEQLGALCDEIRSYEIENISHTGGHLASNLGAIELTVALHRVYDSEKDRIVFDVGHQSYAHKIITGRRDRFPTLRQYGGLSGFPKPYESDDDAFIAGHASNSVSVALGMARARTLRHESYDVCAVIGDGALTGGLAYEGLANAAMSGEPLVVILNDNHMSISKNVGGTERALQAMRVKPGYINFKRRYRQFFARMPRVYGFTHEVKEYIKRKLLPSNMFDQMGFYYLGPVDGHDVSQLETVISWARDMRRPVLVHAVTVKGKGCSYAEERPDMYHGVGRFDALTGKIVPPGTDFSKCFGDILCDMAERNEKLVAITAAMADGTGLKGFAKSFPDRFFDVGIAEAHAVSMAAGMAKQGLVPVLAVYSSFLQRGYDMLVHDVSLLGLHTVFAVDRAGLVGADGETHHGVFDIAYLGSVPGMTILCPASFAELRAMLERAVSSISGPVAVRYPRGGEERYREVHCEDEFILREGSDITLVGYGIMINELLTAADRLLEMGFSAEVIKLGAVKPNSFELCKTSVKKTGRILVCEDVCAAGSVGHDILSALECSGVKPERAVLLDLGDGIVSHGTVSQLRHEKGIDAEGIASCAAGIFR